MTPLQSRVLSMDLAGYPAQSPYEDVHHLGQDTRKFLRMPHHSDLLGP